MASSSLAFGELLRVKGSAGFAGALSSTVSADRRSRIGRLVGGSGGASAPHAPRRNAKPRPVLL